MAARLVAPMMPHLAEEPCLHGWSPTRSCWRCSPGRSRTRLLVAAQSLTIAVQVMGKLRGTIDVAPDADAAAVIAAAEAEPNVARLLDGQRVVKRIHVPGRIVNFVVAA